MNKQAILSVLPILLLLVLAALGCQQQEDPLVTSWRNEGLVEKTEFVSHQIFSTSSGSFKALEVRAVVPTGTLTDEAKTQRLQNRLASVLSPAEDIDIIVITLCEQTGSGCAMHSEFRSRGYPIAGRKEIDEEAWRLLLDQTGCP
jgi:hypothetical protein